MSQNLKRQLKLLLLPKRKQSKSQTPKKQSAFSDNKLIGNFGEDYATKFIQKLGYKVIARNYRCKFAEIDIIAIDNSTLVFVEVKTRMNQTKGLPEEAVTPLKMKRILQAANYFILENKNLPQKMRIDVVAISKVNNEYRAKLIKVI